MEGAVWMGKRVTNEIEKVCSNIDQLIKEYHQRVQDATYASGQQPGFGFKQPDTVTLQRC